MNIQYHINSETGLMNLKFKKDTLNPLGIKKDTFEKFILPMLAMNDKFVLTGSLSLKFLGIEPMDGVGDFDFGLTSPFTEDDYLSLKTFFDLSESNHGYDSHNRKEEPKFNPNAHLWQLSKRIFDENNEESDLIDVLKLDIFNDEMLRKRDIITIHYDEFPVKIIHPSITLSYRMRYALDIRSTTTFKYWRKMKEFMDDSKPYYNQIRLIAKMVARVAEHNASIENDKEKLNYLKNLIYSREKNAEVFLDNAFSTPSIG